MVEGFSLVVILGVVVASLVVVVLLPSGVVVGLSVVDLG